MPFERISIDPTICHGQACVKGTRIPVHQIVRMLANGDTVENLLAECVRCRPLAVMWKEAHRYDARRRTIRRVLDGGARSVCPPHLYDSKVFLVKA